MVRFEAWSFCGDFLGPTFEFIANARSSVSVYQALPVTEVSHHQIFFSIIMVSVNYYVHKHMI
jgi:hypothetical protein